MQFSDCWSWLISTCHEFGKFAASFYLYLSNFSSPTQDSSETLPDLISRLPRRDRLPSMTGASQSYCDRNLLCATFLVHPVIFHDFLKENFAFLFVCPCQQCVRFEICVCHFPFLRLSFFFSSISLLSVWMTCVCVSCWFMFLQVFCLCSFLIFIHFFFLGKSPPTLEAMRSNETED